MGSFPRIGDPFDSAAQFFHALTHKIKFPYQEELLRERSPPDLVDEVLLLINVLSARLKDFAQKCHFREGPFPLFHTDLHSSNMIIDAQYNLVAVINWEDTFNAP